MRLYLNQEDINKAVNSPKSGDICTYCPIAQLFKRKYHGKITVSFIKIGINGISKFIIQGGTKGSKIVHTPSSLWNQIKPQHLNFKEI